MILSGSRRIGHGCCPTAEFLSPNAPFPCDMAPYGYQWFSSQDRSPTRFGRGARGRADLDAFIDEALAERGLSRAIWPWSGSRKAQ